MSQRNYHEELCDLLFGFYRLIFGNKKLKRILIDFIKFELDEKYWFDDSAGDAEGGELSDRECKPVACIEVSILVSKDKDDK